MLTRVKHSIKKLWRWIKKHKVKTLLYALGLYLVLMGILFLWAATLPLPDLNSLSQIRVDQSVKLYDRTGQVLLYDISNKNVQRTSVTLDQVSPNITNAIISIEDPNFYTNHGVEFKAILRAIWVDVTHAGLDQGGSTITQQVIKNTVLTNDKSLVRKLKEWILALKMEQVLTKQQILTLYVNQVPFGGTMYGVEEASETFFGKHASEVDLAEGAYLAAILPAPSYYSPYGTHKTDLDTRKNLVLDEMFDHGYITAGERDDAKAEQVVFIPQQSSSIQAPHFVFYVEQYLEQKYGEDAIQTSGWKVTTTLDANMQAEAESIVKAGALSNATKFNASNAGLIALDPTNGQILTMVGSRNYFDTQIDGAYNVTLANRQPGSAFKPFAYAEAFIKGYTPDTVLWDVPTQFSTSCAGNNFSNVAPCYSPVNYDGKFRGPMTLRDAIAQSINVPSVKVLYLAGISDTLQLAKSMGISTLGNADQYGLTLVLGGGEVNLLDMSSAYGTFATDGTHYQPTAILKIEDANGNIIEDDSQPSGAQVLQPQVAEEINDILSDPVARAPLGENEYLQFPGYDVAVKTGTTNNYKDAWTIGYTPNLVVGIWAGNNDNSPMTHNVSGFIVGPMWNQFMQYALPTRPTQYFTRTTVNESGLKPILRGDWQIPGSDGALHEILYWLNKSDPTGPTPPDPTDPQYSLWETGLSLWLTHNTPTGLSTPNSTSGQVQTTQGLMIPVGPTAQ
ncbi:MAG TPA: PBP1A family penicillin-binding protein [Candidatus Paceibacterota bacterium]|nr:PBP1A family penicillin-binding protein [Candidatus Paceibacterota bacterium]